MLISYGFWSLNRIHSTDFIKIGFSTLKHAVPDLIFSSSNSTQLFLLADKFTYAVLYAESLLSEVY